MSVCGAKRMASETTANRFQQRTSEQCTANPMASNFGVVHGQIGTAKRSIDRSGIFFLSPPRQQHIASAHTAGAAGRFHC